MKQVAVLTRPRGKASDASDSSRLITCRIGDERDKFTQVT